ncbi:MAG: glycosyltransferase family 2 protein [Bacteroidales bacterium]|nr:glycosyltransferase family 2 protein [Candidatus Liminaster caballi]
MNCLVSIVIPSFNSKAFIKDTLLSVEAQTYRPIEIIVVDDGSTDGTADYVESLHLPDVRVVRQENGGACVARNRGFAESRGEYIKFFDADDILMPDALEKQVRHLESLAENEVSIGSYRLKDEIITPEENWMGGFLTPLPMYRRSVIEKVGGFDPKMKFWQDAEFVYNCWAHGFRFRQCEELIYEYRLCINPNSITSKKKDWSVIRYFYLKHKGAAKDYLGEVAYNRYFIMGLYIHNTNPIDHPSTLYHFLRKQMPFRIHPAQICGSRVAGYLAWYGGYILPYEWWYGWVSWFFDKF